MANTVDLSSALPAREVLSPVLREQGEQAKPFPRRKVTNHNITYRMATHDAQGRGGTAHAGSDDHRHLREGDFPRVKTWRDRSRSSSGMKMAFVDFMPNEGGPFALHRAVHEDAGDGVVATQGGGALGERALPLRFFKVEVVLP